MKKFIGILCLVCLFSLGAAAQAPKMTDDSTKYKISVDYTKTVKKMIAAGKYPWLDNSVNDHNFPLPVQLLGKAVIVSAKIFYFNGDISSDEVIRAMDKKGYRPANLAELLALGSAHPKLQQKFFIVALGSVWQRDNDSLYVPFLGLHEGGRAVRLHWLGKDWHPGWRFLAVPK